MELSKEFVRAMVKDRIEFGYGVGVDINVFTSNTSCDIEEPITMIQS